MVVIAQMNADLIFQAVSKEQTVGSTLLISQMKRDVYTVHLIKKYAGS